jgi:hypothetical protein
MHAALLALSACASKSNGVVTNNVATPDHLDSVTQVRAVFVQKRHVISYLHCPKHQDKASHTVGWYEKSLNRTSEAKAAD